MLSMSIGLIYCWFGVLKFFPNLSPADGLAKDTIEFLTLGLIPQDVSIILLAILEVGIGLGLVFQYRLRVVITMALGHLLLTFIPMLFFPSLSFSKAPFALTLEGQYIVKNIIIICALLFIYPIEGEYRSASRMN